MLFLFRGAGWALCASPAHHKCDVHEKKLDSWSELGKVAQEEARSHKETMEAVEAARAKKRSEKDEEREAARATHSAKIEPLERVAQEKKSDAQASASAAKASRGELDALRAQQKSTFCPAEALVKQEISVVDEGLSSHKDIVHAFTTLDSSSSSCLHS